MHPHKSRDLFILPRQVAIIILVFMVITTCNMPGMLSGKQESSADRPLATSEQPVQGPGSAESPAVLGFVLDPDGAPVAYTSVGGEITDSYGAVSGDLTGSASGWLEIKSLGHATGYVKPGESIGGTAFFEARLTPFDSFQPLRSGEDYVLTLGDVAAPVGEINLTGDDVSALPAYLEAVVYDRVDVGPYLAELDSGETLDLKLAIAVEASSDQLEPVPLASGKTLSLTLFPNASLSADPVMAIFDPEKGMWDVQADACTPGDEGALLCAIPRFSPLIGFFGPRQEVSRMPGAGKHLLLQGTSNEEQAYQEAKGEVEEWLRFGQWQIEQTGALDPQWEAGMTTRLETFADKAEAYAAIHQDESGFSHLLRAADPAMTTDNQPIADRLVEDAQQIAELMADRLLQEGDCGRSHEMYHVAQMILLSGGSQAKADALLQKIEKMGDCDQWSGTIEISFPLTGSQPGLDRWAMESGGGDWSENHTVWMTTNVSTFVLKGEDTVKLNFGQVMYGKKDRHDCHNYLTHGGSGSLILKFDGTYDGYTFTVGDLQPEGGTASIMYGAHGERWDEEEDECVEIQSADVPAPNYTSVLVHGFSGSPSVTMQTILGQADSNDSFSGSSQISNDAVDLGIFPSEGGTVRWHFYHTQKYLPQK